MDEQTAATVIELLQTADNGCPVCVGSLLRGFVKRWPEHCEAAVKAYNDQYGYTLVYELVDYVGEEQEAR